MFTVHGLWGHIQRNNLKSLALLASYLGLFQLLCLVILLPGELREAIAQSHRGGAAPNLLSLVGTAAGQAWRGGWIGCLSGCLCWLGVAWLFLRRALLHATRAEPVTREAEPRLWNIAENLTIAAGLPLPALHVIETPALNAFATGLTPAHAAIGVTRGLLDSLTDRELSAVLAHELVHIRNRDTRLLAISTLLSGIVMRMAWVILSHHVKPGPRLLVLLALTPFYFWEVLGVVVWASLAAAVTTLVVRLALSRTREILADAGAVDLTGDPGSLLRALRKVDGRASLGGLDPIARPMLFAGASNGLLSSHPSLASRMEALRRIVPDCMPIDVASSRPAMPAVSVNVFRQRFGDLLPTGEADAPRRSLASPLAGIDWAAFWKELKGHRPPAWVSHPYVLVPTVALNFAFQLAVGFSLNPTGFGAIVFGPPKPKFENCFVLGEGHPYTPGNARFTPPPIDEARFRRLDVISEASAPFFGVSRQRVPLLAADAQCPDGKCGRDRNYDRAIREYMQTRMEITLQYDKTYGAPGLEFAQIQFDTPDDRKILAGVERRVAGGSFDAGAALPSGFALALSHPAASFVPCRRQRSDAAVDEPAIRP